MPSRSGQGGKRSDCTHVAKCGHHSRYYCRMYCDSGLDCMFLSSRSKKARKRIATVEK